MAGEHHCFWTVNYLFATYLQTREGGSHRIEKVEKVRPGKAKFYFNISDDEAEAIQLRFHESVCSEFEQLRKKTIDLTYVWLFALSSCLFSSNLHLFS